MAARLIKIFFLLSNATLEYLLLMCTKKNRNSFLVHGHFLHSGGTRTYLLGLLPLLRQRGATICLVVEPEQADEEMKTFCTKYSVPVIELPFKLSQTRYVGTLFFKGTQEAMIYQLKELTWFWKAMRKQRAGSCLLSEADPGCLLFLFLSPVSVWYVLHTVATLPLDALKRSVLNFSLSSKKLLLTVSEFSRRMLLQNWTVGKHLQHVRVVYNYYEPSNTDVSTKGNSEVKEVLTLGSAEEYKNPLFWISVARTVIARHKGKLNFVWAGDGSLLEACRAATADEPCIQFIGNQKDVDSLFKNCSVYFQPSQLESLGISVLGAMYYAKPCVVSNRQGLPETVVHNVSGKVVNIDTGNDSVEAIMSLLNDGEQAAEFGENGKQLFLQKFTKEKWQQEMNSIISAAHTKQMQV